MPLFGGRRRGAQTDTPEPGPDFEAGHEVLDLLGLGATVPYPDFVRRVHQDAAEWYEPDRGDLPAEAVWRSVRGLLVEHGRAFELDWKWGTPADLLAAAATVVPDLTYTVERMERTGRDWDLRCRVYGEPVAGVVDTALPHHVVDLVNPVLQVRAGLSLEYYSSGADAHCFLVAPADRAAELRTPRHVPVLG